MGTGVCLSITLYEIFEHNKQYMQITLGKRYTVNSAQVEKNVNNV